ncbi:hypothetical protein VCRA2119O147_560019 [Vibrio crassostreae]|nr:hypothetical protein VCRA2119O147_560019 [Vibrio crassostreae]CAK2910835.1 hypothetical protein VCRA2110O183_420024 [Vibrio crassostreae]CAK2985473.1 hypothetical protein VCRA2121O264_420025 [Vibrio crassostreae]CAK3522298.1 hypothetical protein VCRA2128O309_700006 [Vibrio crassostreae]
MHCCIPLPANAPRRFLPDLVHIPGYFVSIKLYPRMKWVYYFLIHSRGD